MYLKRFKRINVKVLKSWCRQILKGLSFLHSRNPPVIHRDLKCDNIFITGTTGSVKIGDLGLATLKNKSHAKSVIGTPEFMAPEMYEEQYDESVDVYAFGMCLLEMVTGEYPYSECAYPAQIYRKVIQGTKPACFERTPKQYPEIRDIIDRCIRVRKEERATVKQLLSDDFFTPEEQFGIRIDIKNRENDLNESGSEIQMQLCVFDEKKRTQYKFKENEGLQFAFDIEVDKAEEVVSQMIEQQHIPNVDTQMIIKLIKDKVEAFKRDREYRHAEMKRQREEEERRQEEIAVKEEIKARQKEREALQQQQANSNSTPALCNNQAADVHHNNLVSQASGSVDLDHLMITTTAPANPATTTVSPTSMVAGDGNSAAGDGHATSPSTATTTAAIGGGHTSSVKKPKKKIVLEILSVVYGENNQPIVSCKMDTAHKTVTFRFSPDSDQSSVIAAKLVNQDCITEHQSCAVIEQLEKVIELVRDNPDKVVGLKLTSVAADHPTTLNVDESAKAVLELNSPIDSKPTSPIHVQQHMRNASNPKYVEESSKPSVGPPIVSEPASTVSAATVTVGAVAPPPVVKQTRFAVSPAVLNADESDHSATLPAPSNVAHPEYRKLSAIVGKTDSVPSDHLPPTSESPAPPAQISRFKVQTIHPPATNTPDSSSSQPVAVSASSTMSTITSTNVMASIVGSSMSTQSTLSATSQAAPPKPAGIEGGLASTSTLEQLNNELRKPDHVPTSNQVVAGAPPAPQPSSAMSTHASQPHTPGGQFGEGQTNIQELDAKLQELSIRLQQQQESSEDEGNRQQQPQQVAVFSSLPPNGNYSNLSRAQSLAPAHGVEGVEEGVIHKPEGREVSAPPSTCLNTTLSGTNMSGIYLSRQSSPPAPTFFNSMNSGAALDMEHPPHSAVEFGIRPHPLTQCQSTGALHHLHIRTSREGSHHFPMTTETLSSAKVESNRHSLANGLSPMLNLPHLKDLENALNNTLGIHRSISLVQPPLHLEHLRRPETLQLAAKANSVIFFVPPENRTELDSPLTLNSPVANGGVEEDSKFSDDLEFEEDEAVQLLKQKHRKELEILLDRQRRELNLLHQKRQRQRAHTAVPSSSSYPYQVMPAALSTSLNGQVSSQPPIIHPMSQSLHQPQIEPHQSPVLGRFPISNSVSAFDLSMPSCSSVPPSPPQIPSPDKEAAGRAFVYGQALRASERARHTPPIQLYENAVFEQPPKSTISKSLTNGSSIKRVVETNSVSSKTSSPIKSLDRQLDRDKKVDNHHISTVTKLKSFFSRAAPSQKSLSKLTGRGKRKNKQEHASMEEGGQGIIETRTNSSLSK
uniref:non-specific serine/threonine protein kinase n=1 Tax=Ditylenchus dipsaci TaxID=166011 RepID=A0A915DPJ5_9BILA